MASLHKDPRGKSPYWYAAYTDQGGVRRFKSTKTTDKKQAGQVAQSWERAVNLARTGKLNLDQARQVIASGVADVLAASGQSLPSSSIRDWVKRWMETKELENEASTHSRYHLSTQAFLKFLDAKADQDLGHLDANTILEFRDACTKKVSVSTANTHLRVIRACLNAASRQGLLERNPASQVSAIKERGESKKRALTIPELQKLLQVCGKTPWRGLVLVGLYTGQRLGDCARLTWQQVDLPSRTIWFVTEKTGKRLSMHLAKPLLDCLAELPSADDPKAWVFPRFAALAERISSLSNAFAYEILIPSGLMPSRPPKHKSTGRGRSGKRVVNPVSFHSLRHSFTTMLKATGASNALAQLIVGHDSPVVSARYTHLASGDTVDSISKLPDVTQ